MRALKTLAVAVALLSGVAVADVVIKSQGTTKGPVASVDFQGAGISAARSGSTGVVTLAGACAADAGFQIACQGALDCFLDGGVGFILTTDAGYVTKTGDTMSGKLTVSDGGYGFPDGTTQFTAVYAAFRSVSASASVAATDSVVATFANAAAVTLTMPAANAVTAGRPYRLKDGSCTASAKNLTVAAAGVDTIDGAASVVIAQDCGSIDVASDGTSKWVIE